jgi:hypothetical protein
MQCDCSRAYPRRLPWTGTLQHRDDVESSQRDKEKTQGDAQACFHDEVVSFFKIDLVAAVPLERDRFHNSPIGVRSLHRSRPAARPKKCSFNRVLIRRGRKRQSLFCLWLYDELTFHSAVPDPTTIAAVEGVRPRRARHEFHNGRNSLFELEAVIIRAEDKARLALLVRSVGAEIDLETVRLIERRDS